MTWSLLGWGLLLHGWSRHGWSPLHGWRCLATGCLFLHRRRHQGRNRPPTDRSLVIVVGIPMIVVEPALSTPTVVVQLPTQRIKVGVVGREWCVLGEGKALAVGAPFEVASEGFELGAKVGSWEGGAGENGLVGLIVRTYGSLCYDTTSLVPYGPCGSDARREPWWWRQSINQ